MRSNFDIGACLEQLSHCLTLTNKNSPHFWIIKRKHVRFCLENRPRNRWKSTFISSEKNVREKLTKAMMPNMKRACRDDLVIMKLGGITDACISVQNAVRQSKFVSGSKIGAFK